MTAALTAPRQWPLRGVACSKRSDSGERCEVKKAMKSRGRLGREVRERLSEFLTKVRSGIPDPGIPSD